MFLSFESYEYLSKIVSVKSVEQKDNVIINMYIRSPLLIICLLPLFIQIIFNLKN